VSADACTEPDGPLCMTCHRDDETVRGLAPRTFVIADAYPTAREWCRLEKVRLFARTTIIATAPGVVSQYLIRPADRVVVLGHPNPAILADVEAARRAGGSL